VRLDTLSDGNRPFTERQFDSLSSVGMVTDERDDEQRSDATDLEAHGADAFLPTSRKLRRVAARLDSKPTLVDSARKLRRRLPGDENFGDPLSIAGDAPVEVVARGVSAFVPERESFLGEIGFAGLQVWQSLSEATGRGRGEVDLALLFTDLVGFSSWALGAGDAAALTLLRVVGSVVEASVLAHGGRIVKRLGDGLMASFPDARSAVEAALDAQEGIADIEIEGYRPRMRAGVHWGRPRRLGGDYLGIDVNIAARVGDAAKADQVLVSDSALDRIEVRDLRVGRQRRLRADGAPRDMLVAAVSRNGRS
jgi:adenylate cyclase